MTEESTLVRLHSHEIVLISKFNREGKSLLPCGFTCVALVQHINDCILDCQHIFKALMPLLRKSSCNKHSRHIYNITAMSMDEVDQNRLIGFDSIES